MSNTLVCLSETLPFFTHDICKEKSFNYDSSVDSDSSNKTEIKESLLLNSLPQDENKYAKQPKSLDQTVLKRSLSRKREASNILVECVKRRENMQNMEFNSIVPFEPNSQDYLSPLIRIPIISGASSESDNSKISEKPLSHIVVSDIVLTDSSDSGIDSSKENTPSLSPDNTSLEDDCINSMEVDSIGEQLSLENQESSVGNLSPKSNAISEDLDGLILEESLSKSSAVIRKPGIIQSLFKDFPSMLYFSTKDEIVEPLPSETISLMKWKLSTITPVLIRETVLRCGFNLVDADTTEDWLGTWGKHLKCLTFRKVKSFQKVNHYPGSFHLGRKDKLWNNIRKMQNKHGKDKFSFFPDTYVLPADIKVLKKVWEEETDRCWITKPCASARGTGVKVIHKWSQVPKNRPAVVQRYICDPYLINGSKFDLRIYVLVPSVNPLRIYVYQDGLVRFASEKYSLSNKSFSNRFVHLTNYSINKKSSAYTSNEDENICQGHKWSLKSFWSYMSESGIDVDKIKSTIVDLIIKTVISSERSICRLMRLNTRCPYNCFELFGFDIMLDKELQPWLLEVNISPSLHTKSTLDFNVKGPLVKDMLNIAGFEIPVKGTTASNETVYLQSVGNRHQPVSKVLLSEEMEKHAFFCSKYAHSKDAILDNLTLDDLYCLMESEDEYSRCGSFVRVFPTNTSVKYFTYFDRINYYNVLLNAWEQSFSNERQKGIKHIQELFNKLILEQNKQNEKCENNVIPESVELDS